MAWNDANEIIKDFTIVKSVIEHDKTLILTSRDDINNAISTESLRRRLPTEIQQGNIECVSSSLQCTIRCHNICLRANLEVAIP